MKLTVFTSFADQMTEDARHYIQNFGNCIQNFGSPARIAITASSNRYAGYQTTRQPRAFSFTVIGIAMGLKEKAGEIFAAFLVLRPKLQTHFFRRVFRGLDSEFLSLSVATMTKKKAGRGSTRLEFTVTGTD